MKAAQRASRADSETAVAPGWLGAYSALQGRHVEASRWLDIAAEVAVPTVLCSVLTLSLCILNRMLRILLFRL